MQYREWRFIDKSKWGDGPWQDEPDKVQWQDEETGLPCLAVRHEFSGHWCGYVGVSNGHRYYGADYDKLDVAVHGGLTFADYCSGDQEHGICHLPDSGEPDAVYWYGFDCHHGGELAPGDLRYRARYLELGLERFFGAGTYRTLEYVKAECARLTWQLAFDWQFKPKQVVCLECDRICSSDDMNPNICEVCGHVDASHIPRDRR